MAALAAAVMLLAALVVIVTTGLEPLGGSVIPYMVGNSREALFGAGKTVKKLYELSKSF
jgi:hypothetical protein